MADSGKPGPVESAEGRASAGDSGTPPGVDKRLRLPLRKSEEVRSEMARLYRDWKAGRRSSAEVSRMLNGLSLIGREIERTELAGKQEELDEQLRVLKEASRGGSGGQ